MVEAGRIIWVTFHPSYTYEDFVEGYRPEAVDKGITYDVVPGPFRIARQQCEQTVSKLFHAGQIIKSSTNNEFEVVEVDSRSLLLKKISGSKGEGQYTPISLWVVERLIANNIRSEDVSTPGSDHQSGKLLGETIGVSKGIITTVTAGLRAIMEHFESVQKHEFTGGPVVMVIDEINRADLSRVFGELITLLEPDKRLGGSEERRVVLPYSQQLFSVPMNLHIIGTMNAADRSLALMDYAFRRRFFFEELLPDPSLCPTEYGGVHLSHVLAFWNKRIAALLSRNYQVGHASFMEARLEETRKREGFEANVDGQLRAVATVVKCNILPLLLEYFHDDWRKAALVLQTSKEKLLADEPVADLDDSEEESFDLAQRADYDIRSFWDPKGNAWNAKQFRSALGF